MNAGLIVIILLLVIIHFGYSDLSCVGYWHTGLP